MKSVAIVLGTYNRLACLQRAIASIRASVGAHPFRIVACDGGSTDGTREYLQDCLDVILLDGGLDGAVQAFNKGFELAVDAQHDYVMHLNDDAEILTAGVDELCPMHPIAEAIDIMESNPKIGEVAFAIDLRGAWGFESINGAPYANFGVVRREAGMQVAEVQGDSTGRAWWNPIYRTYGADCEFGANLWRLGWIVHPAKTLRVHDVNHQDELRKGNTNNNKNGDGETFWSRWRTIDLTRFVPPHIRLALDLAQPNRSRPPPPVRARRPRGPNPEYKK